MFDMTFYKTKQFLIVEFIFLFLCLPILLFFITTIPVLPFLWIVSLWCFFILKKEAKFTKENFVNTKNIKKVFFKILIHFLVITVILLTFIVFFMPDKVFILIRENPLFWLVIMIVYPILSVYPQELVYRAFFFYRYKEFIKNKNLFILGNALVFGYMHILFHNSIAVFLTIGGGVIFAKVYEKTNSLMIVSIAHALYGCMIFTIGLGEYFYSGTMLTVAETFKF